MPSTPPTPTSPTTHAAPVPVAIVGASGYSGAELLTLLLRHPHARIAGLFGSGKADASGAALRAADLFPRFRNLIDLPVLASDPKTIASSGARAVFLCTPHDVSESLAQPLLDAGLIVLDLSAAFRLPEAQARRWYNLHDHAAHLLPRAVYALPEIHRDRIAAADLLAIPGCYPTSAILPLRPLVASGALASRPIIDSTSGVSGAGRKAEQRLLFSEVSQQAYSVLKHRHQPEIDLYAGTQTIFTPHLGPYDRGILSTIHADLAPGWTEQRLRDTLAHAYANEPFVRLCPPGVWPAVKDVAHTNFCDIALAVDESLHHVVLSSAIDNLVKGAAGQALQAFNIRFRLPETTALLPEAARAGDKA